MLVDEVSGGGHRFGEVPLVLQPGLQDYNLDDASVMPAGFEQKVHSIRQGIRLIGLTRTLDWYTSQEEFWGPIRRNSTQGGRPDRALIQDRTITLHPIPASADTLVIPVRLYNDPLASDGLWNEDMAFFVIHNAVMRWALHNGYTGIAREQAVLAKDTKDRIVATQFATPRDSTRRESRRRSAYL